MRTCLLAVCSVFFTTAIFAQPSDAYLTSAMNAGLMPGANLVIIKEGKWVYSKSLGQANIDQNIDVDRETIFMMASVSKTMIATAVMQLWEKGSIDLDIDVNHYLPFSVRPPLHPSDSITMRMLLTHTSAIKDNWNVMAPLYGYGDSPVSMDTFMFHYLTPGGDYYYPNNYYSYAPGAAYNYSNIGSTLAAYIVERITGDAFSHYCDTAIFKKICMDNTSFLLAGIADTGKIARPYSWNGTAYEDNGLYGYPDYPDGQLRTNITALARFMTMYMNHGIYEGTRLLDSTTVDYMMMQQTNAAWFQGLIFYSGISSNGDTLWGHNGGDAGVNTAMYFNFQKQTGVIVLTNGDGTVNANADLLADTLYKYGLTIMPSVNDTFPVCHINTGVPDVQIAGEIRLFPNPSSGICNIIAPLNGIARILSLQGQQLAAYNIKKGQNEIVLPGSLSSGMYMVNISTETGMPLAVKRLVITR